MVWMSSAHFALPMRAGSPKHPNKEDGMETPTTTTPAAEATTRLSEEDAAKAAAPIAPAEEDRYGWWDDERWGRMDTYKDGLVIDRPIDGKVIKWVRTRYADLFNTSDEYATYKA